VSRGYRPADFEDFLRERSEPSPSRQYGQTDQSPTNQGSRERSDTERRSRETDLVDQDVSDRLRSTYRDRVREYSLRESELQTLLEIGKFRIVPEDDLARLGYSGHRSHMENDVRNLRRQGLVEQRSIEDHGAHLRHVLALTKEGHRLLSRHDLIPERQAIYHGFAKPKEARHDADLYRLYHQVADAVHRGGGEVRRVVLDYELKQELYRKLSRVDPDDDVAYERIRVANEYHLKVVNGKIPVPDLRIEYEDESREIHRLDLEIATRDYRPQGLAEKARAGFHLFAREQDHPRLRRILDDEGIVARILAL
jgi:hypothetical protein